MADSANVALGLALTVASVVLYAALSRRLGQRHVAATSRPANAAWQAWWALLAGSSALGVVGSLLGMADRYSLRTGILLLVVNLILIFLALWALSFYLGFLVTGRQSIWWPLAVFYLASLAGWFLVVIESGPIGTTITENGAAVAYTTSLDAHPWFGALFLLLLLPTMAGAASYAYLAIKAHDRTIRFRIGVVSVAILIWFGSSLIGSATGWSDLHAWPLISRLISLSAAASIYVAHFPPRWLAQRLEVRAADEHEAETR